MRMGLNTEELLHVFDCHMANPIQVIEGDEAECTKEYLITAILDTREGIKSFRDNYLVPMLCEIEERRNK